MLHLVTRCVMNYVAGRKLQLIVDVNTRDHLPLEVVLNYELRVGDIRDGHIQWDRELISQALPRGNTSRYAFLDEVKAGITTKYYSELDQAAKNKNGHGLHWAAGGPYQQRRSSRASELGGHQEVLRAGAGKGVGVAGRASSHVQSDGYVQGGAEEAVAGGLEDADQERVAVGLRQVSSSTSRAGRR